MTRPDDPLHRLYRTEFAFLMNARLLGDPRRWHALSVSEAIVRALGLSGTVRDAAITQRKIKDGYRMSRSRARSGPNVAEGVAW